MADVHITKPAAAQRQTDAAIRILFSQEDPLAVHTIVAAAHGILFDLDNKHQMQSVLDGLYASSLKQVREHFPRETSSWNLRDFKSQVQSAKRKPANFLKHADRDPDIALNPETLKTDYLLLEACALYVGLGFELTPAMWAFSRWHLAVYPHEPEDQIKTAAGLVHKLERSAQLQFGAFLLSIEGPLDI